MKKFIVAHSGEKGKAILAAKDLRPGEVVLTFEGRKRVDVSGKHTLQIGLHEHLVVDAPGRYVNHSCAPNCGIVGSRALVTMRSVEKNEEITFDYAMTELHSALGDKDCLCGAERCRGRITGFSGLPEALKAEYRLYISDYLRDLEK